LPVKSIASSSSNFEILEMVIGAAASDTICEKVNNTAAMTAAARVAAGLVRQLQAAQHT